ncbi:hypothetical protein PVV74_17155 [Roseovarius sp. SK2]|uniref:hypothetical protein n=1 Tax=Roseovarius TaxID=74030 RepID=UPI00237B0B3F|nr:hypothetical protein [Roseovarius sp. SK2]MDD9727191.1 hypothetical protein [Roseovarius sp. SK2]
MPPNTTDKRLTEPEHVERIRKYVEWPYTTRDIIVLDSDLVRITAGDLADLLAERDALSAKLQEPVEVKPLEWESGDDVRGIIHHRAKTPIGIMVYDWRNAHAWKRNYVEFNGDEYDSLEAAKAAAQAHHDARVRAMLADRGE